MHVTSCLVRLPTAKETELDVGSEFSVVGRRFRTFR